VWKLPDVVPDKDERSAKGPKEVEADREEEVAVENRSMTNPDKRTTATESTQSPSLRVNVV
jgi:hypothetical protein